MIQLEKTSVDYIVFDRTTKRPKDMCKFSIWNDGVQKQQIFWKRCVC